MLPLQACSSAPLCEGIALPACTSYPPPLSTPLHRPQVSEDPCLLLADGFLTPAECGAVRALGGPHLKRSKVSAGEPGVERLSESRVGSTWGLSPGWPGGQSMSTRARARLPTADSLPCAPAGDETPLRTSWGVFLTGRLQDDPVARQLDDKVLELTQASGWLGGGLGARQEVGKGSCCCSSQHVNACSSHPRARLHHPTCSWRAAWRGGAH